MRLDTRKMTTLALLVAVAMILSYVESLIPPLASVPGVKLGLANIATVFALYSLGAFSAATVSIIRVCLSALLFGNGVSFIYSLSGAVLSLAVMIILSKLQLFSPVGISVAGGLMHNVGQVTAAVAVMNNAAISYYLVPLAVSGTLAGVVIGLAAGITAKRLKKFI